MTSVISMLITTESARLIKGLDVQSSDWFKDSGSDLYKDTRLLIHYGYLFVREAVSLCEEHAVENCDDKTQYFDMIQGTNWNNVRFKPPPSFDSDLGWLMEFRSMDVPITAREKTALVFFVTLFARIVLDEKLKINFYIPISAADENFKRCVMHNADVQEKFKFRRYFCEHLHGKDTRKDEMVELILVEPMEGTEQFSGFRALIIAFVQINAKRLEEDSQKLGYSIVERIWDIFDFYVARCKGELTTNARFMLSIVEKHPEYKQVSVLSDEIVTDLISEVLKVQKQDYHLDLFGHYLMRLDDKL